jgi:hypothetical protein
LHDTLVAQMHTRMPVIVGGRVPAAADRGLPRTGQGEDQHMMTIQWMDNFDTACQQAGRDQKLVLLDFFSPT